MSNRYFKVVIYTPRKTLFSYLHKNLISQNLELFYLPAVEEVEQYVKRIRPKLAILYVDHEQGQYRETMRVIQKISTIENLWLMLLVSKDLPFQRLRNALPVKRVFVQRDEDDYQQIAHNLLFVRGIEQSLSSQVAQNQYEENLNQGLKIIYQEKNLSRILERLVNYLPKLISMDYWAIFTLDQQMSRINHFSQFVPPTRRQKTFLTNNLEQLAEGWLRRGKPFLSTPQEEPAVFQKLYDWGWPIAQLYFIPIYLKELAIGGILVGGLTEEQLEAQDVRFLNEVSQFLSKRILDEHLPLTEMQDVNDFSDQLLANHFDEERIYQYTCQKLTEITHASSTIFWQYNKGFGFLFPKSFHFLEGNKANAPHEKDMIFFNKESFLSRLINRGKMQSLENIAVETRLDTSTKKMFQKLQYRQVLIIPVRIQDEITGALIVNKHREGDLFTVWQIHKAEEIVKRTQRVIEDSNSIKEANLKLKQLSKIFELGGEIKLGLSLYALLSRITLNLRKTLGWNDVAILLEDEHTQEYRVINQVGFNEKLNLGFDISQNIPVEEFKQRLQECEKINNSYFLNAQSTSVNGSPSLVSHRVTEWQKNDLLIIPLETRNKVLGYMLVCDPVDRLKPTVEKVMPLEYYASQAAISVENSQLYEELRSSQERYRSLAETMSLGLMTCDQQGNISYGNAALESLLEYSGEEMLGKNLLSFFSERSHESLQHQMQELVSDSKGKKDPSESLEMEVVSKSEEIIPVSVLGFPFFERRQQTGFFLILNDLRVIKRLERMKADFNSMIVHDLRSPMNVIQGFVELIRNKVVGAINDEQEELLDIVKENVKKVLALIDNFLVASKLEVGKFNIERKMDDINGLIRHQVASHKVLLKNKNIEVTIDLDSELPLLFFDSLRIDQVLNNLLSNAMKFTPENGQIFVRSALAERSVDGGKKTFACISVQDTGVGIPQEKLPYVFEKYEQVDANQNFNIRGTGLGLSICREIVNLHGGEIWVESDSQSGSTFSFTLPVKADVENLVEMDHSGEN